MLQARFARQEAGQRLACSGTGPQVFTNEPLFCSLQACQLQHAQATGTISATPLCLRRTLLLLLPACRLPKLRQSVLSTTPGPHALPLSCSTGLLPPAISRAKLPQLKVPLCLGVYVMRSSEYSSGPSTPLQNGMTLPHQNQTA
jgi:hypothetical protein